MACRNDLKLNARFKLGHYPIFTDLAGLAVLADLAGLLPHAEAREDLGQNRVTCRFAGYIPQRLVCQAKVMRDEFRVLFSLEGVCGFIYVLEGCVERLPMARIGHDDAFGVLCFLSADKSEERLIECIEALSC